MLVKQTAWKGRHKIQDRWESEEYQVVGQPTPGVPVYMVKGVAGGRTRVLHGNLLLPLQGRVRQQGEVKREGISSSEDEEEGREEMPKVARAPQGRPRRTTKPMASPTQQKEASLVKDASADLESGTSNSRLLSQQRNFLIATPSSPEPMTGDADNGEEEMYTDSLTSHTTASGSTTADFLTSTASVVEDISHKPPSLTESQFSTVMPYLEESTQPDQTLDSVFTHQPNQQPSDSVPHGTLTASPPKLPAPRKSARSTKGAPSVHLGKVYTYSTIVSKVAEAPKYKQTLFVPCIPND